MLSLTKTFNQPVMKYWIILFFAFLSTSTSAQKDLTQKELKEIVEKYFITKDVPIRYYSNILIRMDGEVTQGDVAFMNQLTDNLKSHIDKWDVSLISEGTSNLILSINQPRSESYPQERFGNKNKVEIISKREPINIPAGTLQPERNKILYYKLMKSLIKYYKQKEVRGVIPKTVFVLNNPEDVSVNNPIDFQIIKEIYSAKYDEKLKTVSSKNIVNNSKHILNPSKLKYARTLALLTNILSVLLTSLFFIFLLNRGVFKRHNYVFWEYFKQGCWVLFTALLYLSLNLFLSYLIPNSSIITTLYAALSKVLIKVLLIFAAVSFASIVIIYFAEKKILEDNKSLVVSILFPFVTTLLVPTTLILILFLLFVETDKSKNPFDVVTILLSTKTVFILIAIFRVFFIFFNRKSESIINQKDVELARMSEMHRKAELQSLRAKINPHFLYNSLNSIASLASIDPKKTEQMALSLSDFFKYSINREQKQTNPLPDELKAVETYLDIEKVRFGERLTYSLECPEQLKSVQIPQLLIQPLVENAVKHGVSKLLENGEVRIVVSELEFKKISIRVYDNGPGFPDGPMSGFGIRNTHERMQLIYGSKASINWQNDPEKYIEIVLPKHSE